jgi:hypothetical protein
MQTDARRRVRAIFGWCDAVLAAAEPDAAGTP